MSKSTKWLLGILIGVVVIAAGFFGYIFMNKPKNNIAIVPTPTATSSVISTADWKTYTNKDLGFSFKYPANCAESSSSMVGGIQIITNNTYSNDCNFSVVPYDNLDAISISVPTPRKSLSDFTKDPDLSDIKQISFQGNEALTGVFTNNNISYKEYVLYIVHNSHLYEISYVLSSKGQNFNIEISKQIISTFQFTDSAAVSTADWKTYENKDLGFSFKYPSDWKNFEIKKTCNGVNKDECDYLGNTIDYSYSFFAHKKGYQQYLAGTRNTQKVNPNWTVNEFKNSDIYESIYTIAQAKKFGTNALLTIEYTNYECSPSIDAVVSIPTNNKNYPNLRIAVSIDSKELGQDPLMIDYVKNNPDMQCDPPFGQIAKKIIDGAYPIMNSKLEIVQKISDSFRSEVK